MAKEKIGELEFTPGGIANFLEGKIIASDNYKGLFKDVQGYFGKELKTITFEFTLVISKKDDELIAPSVQGEKEIRTNNVLASHTHRITTVKLSLAGICKMFESSIEKVGKEQEELNDKLDKHFNVRNF